MPPKAITRSAPAIFDRAETGVELGYEDADMERGVDLSFSKLQMPQTLQTSRRRSITPPNTARSVLSATALAFVDLAVRLHLQNVSAAAYYGAGVPDQADMTPSCPIILHFGEKDAHIPVESVREFHGQKT